MRRWRCVLLALLLALVSIATLALVLARNGLSARAGLTSLEDRVLYEFRKTAIAFDTEDRQNPQARRWREAARHFQDECAVCHGPAGRGNGTIGRLVFPPAPDLTRQRTQALSDAELYHIVSEGIRFTAMPGMRGHDSEEEIWQLVSLVRELPRLTTEQMKQEAGEGSGGHAHPPGGAH